MTYTVYALQAVPASSLNYSSVIDKQGALQIELESNLQRQAQLLAPENFKAIEITFYDHEVYAGDKLIGCIAYEYEDFTTQCWVVRVNNIEIHRANTWAKCYDYIVWHYKQGTLPLQELQEEAIFTENEKMVQIAAECEKFGFEFCGSDIYCNDIKLGKIVFDESIWRVLAFNQQLQISFDSACEAVRFLHSLQNISSLSDYHEGLLDQPFDKLLQLEWEQLKHYEPISQRQQIAA